MGMDQYLYVEETNKKGDRTFKLVAEWRNNEEIHDLFSRDHDIGSGLNPVCGLLFSKSKDKQLKKLVGKYADYYYEVSY